MRGRGERGREQRRGNVGEGGSECMMEKKLTILHTSGSSPYSSAKASASVNFL